MILILAKKIILALIRLYQRTLSPDHGPLAPLHPYGVCRFSPTCSEYMYQAISTYGLARGMLRGSYRLLRCHPWNQGGIDPVAS